MMDFITNFVSISTKINNLDVKLLLKMKICVKCAAFTLSGIPENTVLFYAFNESCDIEIYILWPFYTL